ncbi:MAG: hypothetical protein GXN93_04825 [Candidatus Diapherotrites archaeon]|nr:hypothetical protein [Candidatus Diapherotrites archaeon]
MSDEDLGKYITKVDVGPFATPGRKQFVEGFSSAKYGGHVLVFGDPSDPYNPLDQVKVVVDPNHDPLTPMIGKKNLAVDVGMNGGVVVNAGSKQIPVTNKTTGPKGKDDPPDLTTAEFSNSSKGNSGDIQALIPSLQTLGGNQLVIDQDIHTGLSRRMKTSRKCTPIFSSRRKSLHA